MVLKKSSYLLLMTFITLLKKINDVIVYQYFKWYTHDIKYMNEHRMKKDKDWI